MHVAHTHTAAEDLDALASQTDMLVTPFTPARPDVNLSAILLPYVSPAASAALPNLPAPGQPTPAAAPAPAAAPQAACTAAEACGAAAAAAAVANGAALAAGGLQAQVCPLSLRAAPPAAAATEAAGVAAAAPGWGGLAAVGSAAVTRGGSTEGALMDCHVQLTNVVRGRGSFGK